MPNLKETLISKKSLIITSIILFVSTVVIILVLFSKQIFGEDNILSSILGSSEGGFSAIGDWFRSQLARLIESVIVILIVLTLTRLIRLILAKIIIRGKKSMTAAKLIDSFMKYISAFAIIFSVLLVWGFNVTTLLASVGVFGIVIGLGAQSLISDIISGLFIVFESDYEVGDIVTIDQFRGVVQGIGIRTTKIIDVSGNVKIINNSEIRAIINMTQNLSLVISDVYIDYNESIEHVEAIIDANIEEIQKNLVNIEEGPFYRGIASFTTYGVCLRFIGKVAEENRFQAERDLNRAIKLLFDANNIKMPHVKLQIDNNHKSE